MKTILTVLILLPSLTQATPLKFEIGGKEVKTLSASEIKQQAKEIVVIEPHENQNITYLAVPMIQLFEQAYGKNWDQREEVVFTCSDGYQPSIPLRAFKNHKAFLAVGRKSGKFEVKDRGKTIPVGPYYLIWENIKDKEQRKKGAGVWPYQVVSLDLIFFAEKFPGLAPPKKHSKQVERGFMSFRTHCMKCHTMNGDGGKKAVELNYPINVTEYFNSKWLYKYAPLKIRFNSQMPALPLGIPNRKQTIKDLIAYLKAMKRAKRTPK